MNPRPSHEWKILEVHLPNEETLRFSVNMREEEVQLRMKVAAANNSTNIEGKDSPKGGSLFLPRNVVTWMQRTEPDDKSFVQMKDVDT